MADNRKTGDESHFDDEIPELRKRRIPEIKNELFSKDSAGGQSVFEVNDFSFGDFVSDNTYAVVDMWAEWCGPCRMMEPVIEALSGEFCGKVAFAKCNTDENQRIASHFMISSIPTLLFFSGGRLCERITGAYPVETVRNRILLAFQI
ncbi:thioredoxin 1 [Methanomicrobium sp. W14]|uniref:thioredoxin n=1 Tax=Methanomicrobium sp. W14 TaxID=2817839 RepID=UPI001AE6284E|nr:thioredoxin [Methanomicrobium sp. W14]MBP2134260.1 thioredoxin 1 [Methanomicrobium sp. W14]